MHVEEHTKGDLARLNRNRRNTPDQTMNYLTEQSPQPLWQASVPPSRSWHRADTLKARLASNSRQTSIARTGTTIDMTPRWLTDVFLGSVAATDGLA
jgi:Leucine-rich repeat (LRR) protein